MQTILIAYLIVLVIQSMLEFANIRHIRRHGSELPAEFRGYIDEAVLKKTQAYSIEHNSLALADSFFSGIIIVVFIYGGLLGRYAAWVSSLASSFILQGLVFFLPLSFAGSLLSIPFSLYGTFRIENRYGFNTMTGKLWLTDFIKSLVVSTVLTGVMLFCGLWIIRESPDRWWLFIWVFFFVFSIFMMYLSPYVIEPLFHKFMPLEGGKLEERIRAMLATIGIRIGRVFKVDASRRSHHTNAYFSGIGKTRRIVLYDTLLAKMDDDEVLAVLAHEAGHWKKRHLLKTIMIFEALSLAGAYAAFRVLKSGVVARTFALEGNAFFGELVILGFVAGIASFPLTSLFSVFSRMHEREADRFAAGLAPKADALATSLIKLSRDNLSNLHPHPLYAAIYFSHPPVVARVRAIRAMAERFP